MRITLLAGAVIGGYFGTWAMRMAAIRLGILNYPNPIVRDHREPVPYLGGLGILLGAASAWLILGRNGPFQLIAVVGFVAFILLGLLDDLIRLHWAVKLAAQTAIAGTVIAFGLMDEHRGVSWRITGLAPLDAVIACLWLVTVVNAVNFIDVCDGLAASVSAVTLLCWGWFAPSGSSAIYLAVAGACLGFLWWNKPPARIYLGDSGSQSLGFLLGWAALDGLVILPDTPTRIVTPILFTAVPLFELVFITTVRVRKGLPWWRGSPDHFAMRLQQAGLNKYQVDLLAALASVGMWISGMVIAGAPAPYAVLFLALLVTGAGICGRALLQWEV